MDARGCGVEYRDMANSSGLITAVFEFAHVWLGPRRLRSVIATSSMLASEPKRLLLSMTPCRSDERVHDLSHSYVRQGEQL